jgi:hypothetical protein
MKRLLGSPIFWIGAIGGIAWLYKNKPEGRLVRTLDELREGGESILGQTGNLVSSSVSTLVDTGEDILGIYDIGDFGEIDPDPEGTDVMFAGLERKDAPQLGNFSGVHADDENFSDPDFSGFDGAKKGMIVDDENSFSDDKGSSNRGSVGVDIGDETAPVEPVGHAAPVGFSGDTLDMSNISY